MSTAGTFDRVPLQVFAQQQSLHFSQFQRTQDAAKSGDASSIAARLAKRLAHQVAAAIALPLLHNLLRVAADILAGNAPQISVEAPDECLADIGVQLRLQQRNVRILAGENPFLEHTLF